MTSRRRTTRIIPTLLGVAATAGGLVAGAGCGSKAETGTPSARVAPLDAKSPLAVLAGGIARSEEPALAALANRLQLKDEEKPAPIPEGEAADWAEVVSSLRRGFLKFEGANGRAMTIVVASQVLDRLAVEPAPSGWDRVLDPTRDLLASALSDPSADVRAASLAAIAKVWTWYPGRAMIPVEEQKLGEWKDKFHPDVLRSLAGADPHTRGAAVMCLASIPIDTLAAPAVVYGDDPRSGAVRHQVLVSFAARPTLLTEDMILRRLHDAEPGIPYLAEIVLKTRGLNPDQVALGRLISSPKPELRASVIPLLKDREDLDPVVWLIRLSHDADELIRSKAAEAMTAKSGPEVLARLREMAAKDASATVRALAGKLVASLGGTETTASLPPLPGSPSLSPRAN